MRVVTVLEGPILIMSVPEKLRGNKKCDDEEEEEEEEVRHILAFFGIAVKWP